MTTRNKKILWQIIAAGIVLILNSCIMMPLKSNLSADIFSSRALLFITEIVSALLDVLLVSLLISVTAAGTYTVFSEGFKIRYYLISCGIIILKHAADILVSGINFGFASVGSIDFISVSISAAMYIIILSAAYVAANEKLGAYFENAEKLQKAYMKAYGTEYDESSAIYPFKKFFDLENPLVSGAFWGSVAYAAFKVGSRVYYDIMFGAPEDASEIIEIIIGYSGDIIESLLVYTCVFFLLSFVLKKKEEAKDNE